MDRIYTDSITKANIDQIAIKLAVLYNDLVQTSKAHNVPIPDEAIKLREIIFQITELFSEKIPESFERTFL